MPTLAPTLFERCLSGSLGAVVVVVCVGARLVLLERA